MGRTTSSSKRKSSKKKTSKISSEARRRKRIRRNKSKKLRRVDDSTFYSDDESTSSVSVSSSSSEDDYKRRARSRGRSNVKSSRKRARRRSSSTESREDSPLVKKRKGSKRNRGSEVRKKIQKKKKPRRDANIRYRGSDSRSCSTCRGESTGSSGESEFERPRGRSRENKKDKRDSGNARSETKKSEKRSRSRSLSSRCSDSSGNHSKEIVAGEINSRRLRSVITVTKQQQEEEANERDRDEHTEEIEYDHDDYPSCRSNDSNDGGSKREGLQHSHVESEKRRIEIVMGEKAFVSNLTTNESTVGGKDDDGKHVGLGPSSDGVGTNKPEKEKESDVSASVGGSGDDNLESILRQKALENLKRFRGGLQTNVKIPADQENKRDISVKQLTTAKAEFVQNKSPKQDGSSVIGAAQLADQNLRPKLRRESSRPTQTDGKIPDGIYSGTESGAAKHSAVCPPDGAALSGNPKEKDHTTARAVNNNFESSISALGQESSGTGSILKQTPTSQPSPKATLLVTKSIVNESAAETSQTAAESSSNNQGIGVINAGGSVAPEPLSCIKPTSEEHSSRERQDDAKDSSQFEKKTMSVLRGGEMVQVNYKVYIPKKAPALARRKLQR